MGWSWFSNSCSRECKEHWEGPLVKGDHPGLGRGSLPWNESTHFNIKTSWKSEEKCSGVGLPKHKKRDERAESGGPFCREILISFKFAVTLCNAALKMNLQQIGCLLPLILLLTYEFKYAIQTCHLCMGNYLLFF